MIWNGVEAVSLVCGGCQRTVPVTENVAAHFGADWKMLQANLAKFRCKSCGQYGPRLYFVRAEPAAEPLSPPSERDAPSADEQQLADIKISKEPYDVILRRAISHPDASFAPSRRRYSSYDPWFEWIFAIGVQFGYEYRGIPETRRQEVLAGLAAELDGHVILDDLSIEDLDGVDWYRISEQTHSPGAEFDEIDDNATG